MKNLIGFLNGEEVDDLEMFDCLAFTIALDRNTGKNTATAVAEVIMMEKLILQQLLQK